MTFHAQPYARGIRSGSWDFREVGIDVVGGVEVEIAVAVGIEKGSARPKASVGSFENFDERSIPAVSKQGIRSDVDHIEVGEAVVVVVSDGTSHSPTFVTDSRVLGDVSKSPLALVAVQAVPAHGHRCPVDELHSVHEVEVEVAVAVVVEQCRSAPERAHDVLLRLVATDVDEVDPGSRSHLGEADPGDRKRKS